MLKLRQEAAFSIATNVFGRFNIEKMLHPVYQYPYHEYQVTEGIPYTLISQNNTSIAQNNALINCIGII